MQQNQDRKPPSNGEQRPSARSSSAGLSADCARRSACERRSRPEGRSRRAHANAL